MMQDKKTTWLASLDAIHVYGSVWESNPQGALFKPPNGFEDRGPHQRCKHSQGLDFPRESLKSPSVLILPQPPPGVYPRLLESPAARDRPLCRAEIKGREGP